MIAYKNEQGELLVKNAEWSYNYHAIATPTKPWRSVGAVNYGVAVNKINNGDWEQVEIMDTPAVWPHLRKLVKQWLVKELNDNGYSKSIRMYLEARKVSEVNVLYALQNRSMFKTPERAFEYLKARGRNW